LYKKSLESCQDEKKVSLPYTVTLLYGILTGLNLLCYPPLELHQIPPFI